MMRHPQGLWIELILNSLISLMTRSYYRVIFIG